MAPDNGIDSEITAEEVGQAERIVTSWHVTRAQSARDGVPADCPSLGIAHHVGKLTEAHDGVLGAIERIDESAEFRNPEVRLNQGKLLSEAARIELALHDWDMTPPERRPSRELVWQTFTQAFDALDSVCKHAPSTGEQVVEAGLRYVQLSVAALDGQLVDPPTVRRSWELAADTREDLRVRVDVASLEQMRELDAAEVASRLGFIDDDGDPGRFLEITDPLYEIVRRNAEQVATITRDVGELHRALEQNFRLHRSTDGPTESDRGRLAVVTRLYEIANGGWVSSR